MSKAVVVTNIIHLRKKRDGDTSIVVFVYTFGCVQKLSCGWKSRSYALSSVPICFDLLNIYQINWLGRLWAVGIFFRILYFFLELLSTKFFCDPCKIIALQRKPYQFTRLPKN
jgi:hypothetical protein